MASMLIMVAAGNSWSVDRFSSPKSELLKLKSDHSETKLPESSDAKISPLALDAVITPSASFDFYQYTNLFPEPVWLLILQFSTVLIGNDLPIHLVSVFFRIFGSDIVTNAP